MTLKRAQIIVGLLLIFGALLATGTIFSETGTLDLEIVVGFLVALSVGIILIIRGGKSK